MKKSGILLSIASIAAALLPCAGCAPRAREAARAPRPFAAGRGVRGEKADELREIFRAAEESYRAVGDYTAVFVKRQRVGGRLQEPRTIFLKFRKPINIYMKWIKEPHKGRELLYSPERYGEKGFVKAGGALGRWTPSIRVDRDGYWVMRDNIHPLDHAGIGYFLGVLMENSRRARESNEGALVDHGEGKVAERPVRIIECVLPTGKGYYCPRCILSFDKENKLPIRMEIYDEKNRLVEEYEYRDLKLNPGLSDADFDRNNKDYNF